MHLNKLINKMPAYKSLLLVLGMLTFLQCNDGKEVSIFDPNYESPKSDPVITSIEPSTGYLAGVDKIIVSGQNFQADAANTKIYFDGLPGTVVSATETQLEVVSALGVIGEDVLVKVSAFDAENFSNSFPYKLSPPLVALPGVNDSDKPWAVTVDKDGNVYTHILRDGTDFGIQKYNPTTDEITSFQSPPNSASRVLKWNALKFGPDGFLYGVRTNRAIFKTDGGVKAFATTKTIASGSLVDLDFDSNGDIWVVGSSSNAFKIDMSDPAINNTFTANATSLTTIQSIRIVNDNVYLLGVVGNATTGTNVQVWKYTIDSNRALIDGELIVSLTDATGVTTLEAFSISVSNDNTLYVGVSNTNGILAISPTKSVSTLYPGVIQTRIINMAWNSAETLYIIAEETKTREGAVITNQRIFGLNMLDKRTAVYHGIE